MLINQEEVEKRLNNPLNLIQRMKGGLVKDGKKNAMDLFVGSKREVKEEKPSLPSQTSEIIPFKSPFSSIPSIVNPPTPQDIIKTEDLISDSDSKIKLALAHDVALGLLTSGLGRLKDGMDNGNIEEKKIPSILVATSKIITDIRKERLEREKINKGDANVHFHFYCPEQKRLDQYETIEVAGLTV